MKTIPQLISERSKDWGDRTFLFFEDQRFSFSDLRREVQGAAAKLRRAGVKQGDRVGFMMANHETHIWLYLAVSWLGATSVEFSYHLKKLGLHTQLTGAVPAFMISDVDFINELGPALEAMPKPPTVIWVGENVQRPEKCLRYEELPTETELFESPVYDDAARLQAISFTSGTTGKPKGAMLSDRWFQVGAKNAAILSDAGPDDVLFLWEPLYHVAGWMTLVIGLQRGIPVAMVRKFSASKCWAQIKQHQATLFHYLGGVLNILLAAPESDNDTDNSLRVVWGAAAPKDSWRTFESRFGVKIREGYGSTEAQNFTHLNLGGPVGSIGLPCDEIDAWIQNTDGNRLAHGQIGEIVVRPKIDGITMDGYFNEPDKTAEVLKDGCVHTGDLGYVDEDGYFYFAGRKKDSLRRKGQNVSAWEVERVINAHPAVEESAVIGVPSEIGEQDIKVFVRRANGHEIDPVDLIRWCERDLAYYQIPRFVTFVDDFPRGPTHRIKKQELPEDLESWDLEQSEYEVSR